MVEGNDLDQDASLEQRPHTDTVEDEKVSTDDLQEKIEALEDFVQPVDIAVFNKQDHKTEKNKQH